MLLSLICLAEAETSSCVEDEPLMIPDNGDVKGKEQSTDEGVDPGVENVVPPETSQWRCPLEDLCQESRGDQVLDKTTCLKCSEGGELVLCSEGSCPIEIYEKCLDCDPRFDEYGRFYCTYCMYKRITAKVHKLRRKAMWAEKKFNNFLNTGKDEEGGKKLKGERPEASNQHVCLSCQDKNEDNNNKEANSDGASQRSEPIHHLPEKTTSSEDLLAGNESKKWKSKLLAGPTIAASLLGDSSRGQNGEGNTRNQMTEGTAGPPMVGPQVMLQPLSALLAEKCSSPQRISSRTLVRRDSSADQSNLQLHHPMKLMEATLLSGKRKRLYWRTEEEDMFK